MDLFQNFSMPKIPFTYIDPGQCFFSEDLKTVHQGLDRLNILQGLALCTGEPGSGKTIAVSAWAETLNPNSVDIRWVEDAGKNVSSFLKRVARIMDIEPIHQAEKIYHKLVDAIEQHHRNTRKKLIIVIDEAQQLPVEVLEQIRCLTNLGQKHPVPLSFILIAHHEFLSSLRQQTMTALRRRLVVHVSLEGLTRDEISSYIEHHIKTAGGTPEIFDTQTYDPIFNHSGGVLRLVNKIAIGAMCKAAEKQQPKVTPLEVTQTINERSEL